MSAATSPGTGLAYGLRRVCAAWGMARSSFYAMTSGQHAEQPPAKRRGPNQRSRTRRCWWRSKPTWRHRPGTATARSGLGFGSVNPGCPQAGAPPDAREQSALAPSLPPPWRQSPTVRSSLMPRTSCGAPMAFGCSRWTTAGAGSSPPSSIGTPSVSAGMSARRPLRRPAADLHGACRAVWLDRGRRGSGAGLADDHGSQ